MGRLGLSAFTCDRRFSFVNCGALALVALLSGCAGSHGDVGTTRSAASKADQSPRTEQPQPAAESIAFAEFFEPSARELKPSAKLLRLNGKRVRLVGWIQNVKPRPQGFFYLAARPIEVNCSGHHAPVEEGAACTHDHGLNGHQHAHDVHDHHEHSAGSADNSVLWPETVRVILTRAPRTEVPFVPRAVEVVGTLEVSERTEPDGSISKIRLYVDECVPGQEDPSSNP